MQAAWSLITSNYLQIVDTLLVATLFYYLFLAVKGTKTVTVLQFLALLGLLYFACQYFKLITIVFIIEKILVVGPIALIIIFAPEIRKMLERAGKGTMLREWLAPNDPSPTTENSVDIVIDTAQALVESRTGALFVFESNVTVDEYVVPGTVLDALLTNRLLANIFDHNNSLHDGAVIIRNSRLYSAGNFLPLSENPQLDPNLGTRHRAALGLTERCPAVAVVVSEERGTMSVAFNGRLALDLTHEQFSEQLWALVEPNENFCTPIPRVGA